LVKSTIVAALGGLLFGFDTAVIAGTTAGLQAFFGLSEEAKGFTVAIAVIGTVFGALLASIPGDKYGRRDSLRGMAVLYLISAVGCALAWDWYSLLFFRFIGGLGIGGSSVLGPMYIAEIAPAKWRGRLVGFFQFNVVAGILVAVDVGCNGIARAVLLVHAFPDSTEPPLAGEKIAARRGERNAGGDRRRERRGGVAGYCCVGGCGARAWAGVFVSGQIRVAHLFGGFDGHVQPAYRH
jgi:MFS family permease